MASLTTRYVVDEKGLKALLTPRDDFIVAEKRCDGDSFALEHGPFDHYERSVTAEPGSDDEIVVTEHISFRLAAPAWRILLTHPVRRSLRARGNAVASPLGPQARKSGSGVPWWAPPDRFDAATARSVSLLCLAMIVTGYLGAIIGQTATFASDEFGTSDRAQGVLFAAVRLGTLLTVVITTLADRKGRRRLLLLAMTVGTIMTVAGAASPSLIALGGTQAVARGMATAIALLVGIMAAETAPRNSRAYVASVLSLTAGLGAGMVVWILPLADLGVRAWRILYVVPVLALPLTWWLARHLRESDRFERHLERSSYDSAGSMLRSRLVLVAAVAFFILLFAAPASQFRNDFLRDERGFSAAQLSLFVIVTNTPVGIGVAIAGKLADRRGRKPVGAFAVFGGTLLTVVTYAVDGWGMWTAGIFASVIGAMAAPALGVYSAEMFGTSRRGRANGIVSLVGLGGSALGLLIVGDLSDRLGSFVAAFSIMAIGPLIVVVLVLALFPETAKRELEDI
ncbi:MAG: MFS transporter, partial [Acidimicrobiales bacterium]